MLTVKALQELGVNTQEGLARCLNNEQFYFRLVDKAIKDTSFEKMKEAVEAGDYKTGFELAHALKGVIGNLSLTPIYKPVCEITELLRERTETDYSGYLNEILEARAGILALCD